MVPPLPPPGPNGQYWSQFLSGALSQRGPNALPYAEDAKWLIRQHLVSLVEAFPSLPPKTSQFTHNDGRAAHLLQAEGTIPILYAGVVYNIPAVVWLLEPYPRSPPSVFLTPTRDMVIKRGHPHVDRSGHVSAPYLRNWVYPSSNLVDLVRTLSHIFGQDPPLYSRENPVPVPDPSPHSQPTPSPSPQQPPSRIYSPPYGGGGGGGGGGRLSQSPQYPRTDDPAEVYRKNIINRILETTHAEIVSLRKNRELEMEGLFATQAALRRREEELSRGLRGMQEEKEGLEQQLQLVLMNTDVLEGWVRDNEGKKRRDEVDVDQVFEPCDPLSRQLMECTAADLAVEDTVYSLDKAVQEGAIPFDMYLKNIRALSREQFFHRAISAKVRAAQVQAQAGSMAARAPQYAS
uniref:Protein ELC n=1 Tax=Anthurium amnicola TaxID=1678845 RepID=A0A1D1XJ06_9ARAE